MITEPVTMPAKAYEVFKRVPLEWMDLTVVKAEIVATTGQHRGTVTRRLSYLARIGLVEIRGAVTLTAVKEIRRVAVAL